MSCAHCCVGAPLAFACASPRVDSAGEPACELCGRRLRTVKHKHKHGAGHACHPRCKPREQAFDAKPALAAPSAASRKRRATSDPGESPEPAATQAITRRVVAPPASTSKKQYNTRREQQIMRLLDETHGRRMAAEKAAAETASIAGERAATHTGFALAFVP